ncbi:MAG: hypothetical protein J6N76_07940 [Lachnospiraceae bacterium]|nr:hypothetical protein [Lachnospiraceae bacterium]
MAFPFLTVFLIFLLFVAFRLKKINKKQESYYEDFWEREARADTVPPVELCNLSYITIPLDKFPLNFSDDPEITVIEDELIELSQKRLLNLNGKTNTDLKEEYGAPNLEKISEYGDNYDRLSVLLVDYAKSLMENSMIEEARTVLEFGIESGTDISNNYILLADCYAALGLHTKLPALKEKAIRRHLMLEASVTEHIDSLMLPAVLP